jgi:hypothetical protein
MTPKFKTLHFHNRKTKFGHLAREFGLDEARLLSV